MSQLIAPTHTVVDKIPLGRRLTEIMQEKGPAYTISAMAKRLDISRETLRLMLKGDREIYNYELDKIAHDLKVSVERILQRDIKEKRKQFDEILVDHRRIESGVALIDEFLQIALGITEKFSAFHKKGQFWYRLRDYSLRSHDAWLEALSFARIILDKYGDVEPLLKITTNLSITYSNRKEKKPLLDLISQVTEYFHVNPQYSGIICFSLARIEESEGHLDHALRNMYQCVDFMERTQIPTQIAKARANLAFFEYRMKNYKKSIEIHRNTIELVNKCTDFILRCNFYQCFAKALIRTNEFAQAIQMLEIAEKALELNSAKSEEYFVIAGQVYFSLAVMKKEPRYAEILVENEEYNINLRKIACKFLIDHYEEVGNRKAREKYEKIIHQRYTAIDLMLYEKDHDIQYLFTLVDLLILVDWK